MAGFAYTALTNEGQMKCGQIEADDILTAQRILESQELIPTNLVPHRNQQETIKVPQAQILAFTRSLAGLLASGVPLSRALSVIERETKHATARMLWSDIHDRIKNGEALAEAMQAQSGVFPDVFIAMVRAGEAGGFIDVVLSQVAGYIDRQRDLRGRIGAALAYPCLLGVIATAVVSFLLVWFIPRFADLFSSFDHELPLLTRIIQAVSDGLVHNGIIIVIGVVVLGLAVRGALLHPRGLAIWERLRLRLPVFGGVVSTLARVRFCRMLGTLLHAGVPLLTALQVSRETVGSTYLMDALTEATERVRQGETLSAAVSNMDAMLPSSAMEMIGVAEASGRLADELLRIAETGEVELDRRLRTLVALVEPLLLLGMAIIVGTIVIGMLMPIFDLWSAIK